MITSVKFFKSELKNFSLTTQESLESAFKKGLSKFPASEPLEVLDEAFFLLEKKAVEVGWSLERVLAIKKSCTYSHLFQKPQQNVQEVVEYTPEDFNALLIRMRRKLFGTKIEIPEGLVLSGS